MFSPRQKIAYKSRVLKGECNFSATALPRNPEVHLFLKKPLVQFYHQTRTCESLARMKAERKPISHVHVRTNTNLQQSEGNGRLKEFTLSSKLTGT